MIIALIELGFDPLLRIGELTIRWQTIGVTLALLAALGVAALMAPDVRAQRPFFRRGRPDLRPLYPSAPQVDHTGAGPSGRPLRLDDMLLIIAAIVPGAVVGGRLVHGLVFWDAYSGQPQMLLSFARKDGQLCRAYAAPAGSGRFAEW